MTESVAALQQARQTASGLDEKLRKEREFTTKEFQELVAYACSLQEYDHQMGDQARLEAITKGLPSAEDARISASTIYKIVEEMGISPQYLEKAIGMRYPSLERQRQDLQEVGAVLGYRVLLGKNIRQYQSLISVLEASFPEKKFQLVTVDYGTSSTININEVIPQKSSWGFKRTLKESWAVVNVCPNEVYLDVYTPLFLRACGETLKDIKNKLGLSLQNITCQYYVD